MRYTGFHRALEIDHRGHRASWQIHISNEIEADRLDDLRQLYRERGHQPPSYTAIVIKAIALAISEIKEQHPQINSFLRDILGFKSIHTFDGVSAGCATALDTEEAVIVGVVLEPHTKPLETITQELAGFSKHDSRFAKDALVFYRLPKAIQRLAYWFGKNLSKVRYERRGTFCLNPVGKFGVDVHVSLPQTSSLQFGMGAVRDRVVARDGKPFVTKTFFLTVSFDRRLMNGRPPSILMSRVREILNRADFDDRKRLENA